MSYAATCISICYLLRTPLSWALMYTVCSNVNINFPFCSAFWGKCLALWLLNSSLCEAAIHLVIYFCHSCHMQKRLFLSTTPFTVWFPFWRGYSSCIKLILSRVFSLKCSWKVLASPIWQGFEGNTKSNCKRSQTSGGSLWESQALIIRTDLWNIT